ncbi:MAG TPA: tryptophan--tRNA ligase [Planctomycetota bacterium]|nr:tryptophan--tRNA ligase [Planctomycetota bacterium]
MRILSGIQPSGELHLGNYFGAIEQHIRLQAEGDAYFFIADYHALTSVQDAPRLRELTLDVAATYFALGLDPAKATFFRQSDVPEVTELTWLLSCVTGMGLLERAHSYKDKVAKGIHSSVGLFTYPVLMAADIIIYKSKLVPVGQDQVQHVEMAQDMAQSFNAAFKKEVFVRPEYRINAATAKVPGTDGEKMSKSYNNTIPIFARGKRLKKICGSIVTDSKDFTKEPLDPDTDNVYALYALFATEDEKKEMRERYVNDRTFGYGHAKQKLMEKIEARFGPAADKYESLKANPKELEDRLREGAKKARAIARATLDEAREAAGLGRML